MNQKNRGLLSNIKEYVIMKKINFDFKTNKYVKELVLLGVLAGIFSLMAILSPNRFLSIYNIRSMAFQIPEFGILTLSMMIVIITGGLTYPTQQRLRCRRL